MRLFLTFWFLLLTVCSNSQEIRRIKITDLENTIRELNSPMIINFWATWCKPCVEELPYFISEVKSHKDSLNLLLVSLDFKEAFPKQISTFALKRNIDAEIFWLDETDADYFCPKIDTTWTGAIPASLFINRKTGYHKFFEEQLSPTQLREEIKAVLKKN